MIYFSFLFNLLLHSLHLCLVFISSIIHHTAHRGSCAHTCLCTYACTHKHTHHTRRHKHTVHRETNANAHTTLFRGKVRHQGLSEAGLQLLWQLHSCLPWLVLVCWIFYPPPHTHTQCPDTHFLRTHTYTHIRTHMTHMYIEKRSVLYNAHSFSLTHTFSLTRFRHRQAQACVCSVTHTHTHTHRQTDRLTDQYIDRNREPNQQMDKQAVRQTDQQTVRQTSSHISRQSDRQAGR